METPRCPDCDVPMEAVDLNTGEGRFSVVSSEEADGILGAVGLTKTHDVEPRMCTECGLLRFYAADVN